MLTSFVQIENPDYVQINIKAEIVVVPYFIREKVVADVSSALQQLFAFDKVDFKQVLYLSKVYEALEALDGVDSVFIPRFRRAGGSEAIPSEGRIALKVNEIPVLNPEDIVIVATGGA
jgi:hypothetical protein